MDTTSFFKDMCVLELASVLAGPLSAQFFAETGARVIKVENHRLGGDVTRSWRTHGENTTRVSAYFSSVNWGKQSIGVDMGNAEGLDLIHRLVAGADIVISSFKPGSAKKLQVDYSTLKRINPAIIYGSITGYGKDDMRVGYDAVIQAESGFMSINGEEGGVPLKMPVALIDILAAHQLKEALLLAVIHRLRTGEGSEVSVSLFDAAVSSLANQGANYLEGGIVPKAKGSLHPNIAPYGESFVTREGTRLLVAIGNDKQFGALCALLGVPHLASDDRFITNTKRIEHRILLGELLGRAIQQTDGEEFVGACADRYVPVGMIRTIDRVLDLPNIPLLRDRSHRGIPTFVGSTKIPTLQAPPSLGEHSAMILTEVLHLEDEYIARLYREGIIA